MDAIEKFRELVDPKKKGGRKRKEILAYVGRNPGCTRYRIAKEVYGNLQSYGSVEHHLRKLREVSEGLKGTEYEQLLDKKRQEDGAYPISLTKGGRRLCLTEGIVIPPDKTKEFIAEFNHRLGDKLTQAQWEGLRGLLPDPMMDALDEIRREWAETGGVPREIGPKKYFKLVSKISEVQSVLEDKVWKVLYPIWWYDAETGVSTTTTEFVGFGVDMAPFGGKIKRKIKRALPKFLPRFKSDVEKSFLVSRVIKERELTNYFEKLVNLIDTWQAFSMARVVLLYQEKRVAITNEGIPTS